jgi:hypothetical protein
LEDFFGGGGADAGNALELLGIGGVQVDGRGGRFLLGGRVNGEKRHSEKADHYPRTELAIHKRDNRLLLLTYQ